MFIENPDRTEQLIKELVVIWEASVKATHIFLKEEERISLRPYVQEALKEIDQLIVVYQGEKPLGFMGIENQKVEMLFLEPACIGQGIGKKLITKAIEEYGVSYVDVNEQNPHAADFYKRAGFVVFERTEKDEMGNPFPILKMKLGSIMKTIGVKSKN